MDFPAIIIINNQPNFVKYQEKMIMTKVKKLQIKTKGNNDVINITDSVAQAVDKSGRFADGPPANLWYEDKGKSQLFVPLEDDDNKARAGTIICSVLAPAMDYSIL